MSVAARRRLVVLIGGALGTALRIGVDDALDPSPAEWPWSTFLVNIAGALILGWVFVRAVEHAREALWFPLVTVGLLGALTTFSTFALEVFRLGDTGRPALAGLYAAVTITVGLLAGGLGMAVAERTS